MTYYLVNIDQQVFACTLDKTKAEVYFKNIKNLYPDAEVTLTEVNPFDHVKTTAGVITTLGGVK